MEAKQKQEQQRIDTDTRVPIKKLFQMKLKVKEEPSMELHVIMLK